MGTTSTMTDTRPAYFEQASGFCVMCDSHFRGQPALGWPDERVRGGWLYAEMACLPAERAITPRADAVVGPPTKGGA